MSLYILYSKDKGPVLVNNQKAPRGLNRSSNNFLDWAAFEEGPFKNKDAVIKRLNQMNIPSERRPRGY